MTNQSPPTSWLCDGLNVSRVIHSRPQAINQNAEWQWEFTLVLSIDALLSHGHSYSSNSFDFENLLRSFSTGRNAPAFKAERSLYA